MFVNSRGVLSQWVRLFQHQLNDRHQRIRLHRRQIQHQLIAMVRQTLAEMRHFAVVEFHFAAVMQELSVIDLSG